MKGYRFYIDAEGDSVPSRGRYTVKDAWDFARAGHKANCIALDTDTREALASMFSHEDSGVSVTTPSWDYMRRCKRVPEALARLLHPQLFLRLDD